MPNQKLSSSFSFRDLIVHTDGLG